MKLSASTPFLHGSTSLSRLSIRTSSLPRPPSFLPSIRAIKSMQGRVVCATSDKTVAVGVVRVAHHPEYKRGRGVRKKKNQFHDPENQFKVGDFLPLEKSRPISKTRTFFAVSIPAKYSIGV